MNAITELIYVEGNTLLTVCNIVSLAVAVEFIGLMFGMVSRLAR